MQGYWGDTVYAERSEALHASAWEQWVEIPLLQGEFKVFKHQSDIRTAVIPAAMDVVFWDAFGPKKQDGVWGEALFEPIFNALSVGGIFVTYSAAGDVKRALRAVGFGVKKLDGPPYKRHMLRARKA
jgi:tRNA U34 5-methylaminomethyl-2-thiouridine-forming methyltransferase MnmC